MIKTKGMLLPPGCQGQKIYSVNNIVDILDLMSDSFPREYEMYSFGDTL